MLAKQVWRLLCEPDSLYARVLRAKYYPDSKFLKAKLKSGASFTWQSILAGIQCSNRGCIWRVVDGSQIDIWEDPWIPNSAHGKILTPRGKIVYTKVEELIRPITGIWDEELVRGIIFTIDANRILSIPISPHGMEDFGAWRHYKNSLFFQLDHYTEWKHQFGEKEKNLQAP
jgi:hypothetical protein